ncbi:N-acetylmuramoyl-L-alanine amidase [Chitinophagaceae bacterium LWZ2-11]
MKDNQEKKLLIAFFALTTLVYSCAKGPYYATNKQYASQAKTYANTLKQNPLTPGADSVPAPADWVGTINFNMRKPNFVIIHHTAQESSDQTLKTFTLTRTQVSAHYVIGRDGKVYHMLNDYLRAWHAGNAKWGNVTDLNSSSIGIELDNNGFEPFSDDQINSLLKLLASLKKNYGIPTANFIGHGDIAPTRKNDPNVRFPWKTLAKKGFGLWYDDVLPATVDSNFNSLQALRIIGYDIKDSTAAIRSFERHFMQDTVRRVLNDYDKKVLFNLYKKYM